MDINFYTPAVYSGKQCPYCLQNTAQFMKHNFVRDGKNVAIQGCFACNAFVALNHKGKPYGSVAKSQLRQDRWDCIKLLRKICEFDDGSLLSTFEKRDLIEIELAKDFKFPETTMSIEQVGPKEIGVVFYFLEKRSRQLNTGYFSFKNKLSYIK